MKKILMALALASTFTAGAIAQSSDQLLPRDPPFGKGNAENDTFHQPYFASKNFYGHSDQNTAPGYSPYAVRTHRQWQ